MDSSHRLLLTVLLGVGAVGFLSVLWVNPEDYKLRSERVARVLYCAIGCVYVGAAYRGLRDGQSIDAFVVHLMIVTALNFVGLAVLRPWSRRDRKRRPPTA